MCEHHAEPNIHQPPYQALYIHNLLLHFLYFLACSILSRTYIFFMQIKLCVVISKHCSAVHWFLLQTHEGRNQRTY